MIEIILILLVSEITYRLIEKPMGKITWSKTKAYFARILDLETKDYIKKTQAVFAAFVLILGSIAIAVSPRAKAEDFNKTQLAQRIQKNTKEQKSDNAKLIKKLKKQKPKKKISRKSLNKRKKMLKSTQLINHMLNMVFRSLICS